MLFDKFVVCPKCGNRNGFTIIIPGRKKKNEALLFLKCPKCAANYDIGLTIKVRKPERKK